MILTSDEQFEIWKATETENRFVLMEVYEAALLAKLEERKLLTLPVKDATGEH